MIKPKDQSHDRVVYGHITYADTGLPAVGVRVTAMDADLLFDDQLGQATTDDAGQFSISYGVAQFRDLFERAPDIYLVVRNEHDHLLTTTRDSVIRDAGAVQEIHVQLPNGHGRQRGRTVSVAGYEVELRAFEALTPEDVLGIARSLYLPKRDERAVELVAALHPALVDDLLRPKLCNTPMTRLLYDVVRVKQWNREVLLALEEIIIGYDRFGGGFTTYTCPPFTINYDTTGTFAVSTTDSVSDIVIPGTATVVGATAINGVPDYVERICFWLQYALTIYTNPPFSLRTPLGGGTIQVYVNDPSYGHAGGGQITINNNLSNDLLGWVLVHELMHLVQEEYETNGMAGGWSPGREGGAVLAEDAVLDPINRYIGEADDFFTGQGTLFAPQNSLKNQSYKQSLFLKYISEQHSSRINPGDEPTIGVETYRALLESYDAHGWTTEALEQAVNGLPWYQSFYKLDYLDLARLDELSSETLLGNFWLACYLKDFGVGSPDRRFDFMEDEENCLADEILSIGTISTLRSVNLQADVTLSPGGTLTLSSGAGGSVSEFGARFYRVRLDAAVNTLRVNFSANAGFTRPLVQVVAVDSGNTVRDIMRTDRTTWSRTVANDRAGNKLDHLLIVVAGTDTGGSFTLSVQDVPAAPDVTVTRWHHLPGTHYEIDSFNWAWTWVSPDIWVDSNMDGVPDDVVHLSQNNKLFIRLRNQGNSAATGISVDFWYQDASGGLSDAAWQRVQNTLLVDQTLTGLSLGPQTSNQWSVDWSPVPSGSSHHFCIRAVVTVPGDPNTDNKRCLSNFGNVVAGSFADLALVRRLHADLLEQVEVLVIPRTRGQYAVSQADLTRINARQVRRGEGITDVLRVRRLNILDRKKGDHNDREDAAVGRRQICAPRGGYNRLERTPDPQGHYPTDPRALPPHMGEADLITIAHSVRGKLIGGFTWAIRSKE